MRIPYRTPDGQSHSYVPDFRVDMRRSPSTIVEVKYRSDLKADWRDLRPRLRAGVAHARAHGMRFKILTEVEIRTPLLDNVRFLKRYVKGPPQVDDPTEEHLVATLETLGTATTRALLDVAYAHAENRLKAVPAMWRLVHQGRIGCRLSLSLTMRSEIWVAEGRGTQWPRPHSYAFPLAKAVWRRLGLPAPRQTTPSIVCRASTSRRIPSSLRGERRHERGHPEAREGMAAHDQRQGLDREAPARR